MTAHEIFIKFSDLDKNTGFDSKDFDRTMKKLTQDEPDWAIESEGLMGELEKQLVMYTVSCYLRKSIKPVDKH